MSSAPTPPVKPYNGRHLIADLHGCCGLDDSGLVECALRSGAHAAGATVIEVRLHGFGTGLGVTGMALLAESHISIHTWPEHAYAAVDIFLCGSRNEAELALDGIVALLRPTSTGTTIIRRGYGAVQLTPT